MTTLSATATEKFADRRRAVLEEVRHFLKSPALKAEEINTPIDFLGNTPLHLLCETKASPGLLEEMVKTLGADVKALNKAGMPPLGKILTQGTPAACAKLIDLGAEMYFPLPDGTFFNAVIVAVAAQRADILDVLLEKGGGIHINDGGVRQSETDHPDWRALHIAIQRKDEGIVRTLLSEGADTAPEGVVGQESLTPLQMAVRKGDEGIVRALLAAGVDPNVSGSQSGWTAVHFAIADGRSQILRDLIEAGADLEKRTGLGLTPLMLAAGQRDIEITRILFKAGVDLDARAETINRQTALIYAIERGNYTMASQLLGQGADPLLTDTKGHTAIAYVPPAEQNIQRIISEAEQTARVNYFERAHKKYKP